MSDSYQETYVITHIICNHPLLNTMYSPLSHQLVMYIIKVKVKLFMKTHPLLN